MFTGGDGIGHLVIVEEGKVQKGRYLPTESAGLGSVLVNQWGRRCSAHDL